MSLAADEGLAAVLAAKWATITTYVAAGGSSALALASRMDWVAITSGTVAIGTFAINWYYKRVEARRRHAETVLRDKLEQQRAFDEHNESLQRQRHADTENAMRIALMEQGIDPGESQA